jgi:Bacterial Ig-like domain (group 2)/PEGA domain
MTLTLNAQNWLATNAGINNCFSSTDVSFNFPGTGTLVGGTADIVQTFSTVGTYGTTAQKNEAIIAGISYNQFITDINGDFSVDNSDVMFVADRDGHIDAPQDQSCAQSALASIVISPTPLTVQIGTPQQLTAACIDQYGATFTCPTLTWSSSDPAKATVSQSGLVIGIAVGSTNISCAEGGLTSNTSVVTVTQVLTPADIVATDITLTPDTTACIASCGMTVDVTWTNNGGTVGTFVPNITINGNEIDPVYSPESLAGLSSVTRSFIVSNLLSGNHTICAYPNPTSLACKTITVNASASFTSNPSGADVYIDGSSTSSGMTPVTVTNLSVGNHTYRLTNDACDNERTGSFTIPTGVITVDVPYITINGSARFTSAPSQARIWIDDVDTEVDTPDDVLDLTPGDHTFELRRAGYENFAGDFTVTLCQRHDHEHINLVQAAAEAGIGGIVMLGLAVGAIMMSQQGKSPIGSSRESPTKGSSIRESPTHASQGATKSA